MMKVLLNRDVWIIANLIITYMGFQVEKRVLLDYKSEDIRADHNIYTYTAIDLQQCLYLRGLLMHAVTLTAAFANT